jgi:hypothetical protein
MHALVEGGQSESDIDKRLRAPQVKEKFVNSYSNSLLDMKNSSARRCKEDEVANELIEVPGALRQGMQFKKLLESQYGCCSWKVTRN